MPFKFNNQIIDKGKCKLFKGNEQYKMGNKKEILFM